MLDDDEIYKSVMNTSRRFKDLTIDLKHCGHVLNSDRLEDIVRKFGIRIEKFKLWGSVQSETSEIAENQLIGILKCIPNVTDVSLRNICINKSAFPHSKEEPEELNLHKLRTLLVDYCMIETPTVFNIIPVNVLRELVFTFEPFDETKFQNFFNRQARIQKLEIFENDKISFEHLELQHLKISSSLDFPQVIRQQPKLRYIDFAITWVEDDTFIELCQLKHLEVLKMLIDQISCREFKSLVQVPRLKELRLDSHSSFDKGHLLELSMMRADYLEKLTLLCTERKIPDEIIIQMANNFRRLKSIELINRSVKVISTIIENFQHLDSLLLDFFAIFGAPEDVLVISEDLKHENLKQLVVTNINANEIENSKSLLKLISVCPNLERIMLSQLKGISIDELRQIIEGHQNLTHLSLEFDEFNFNYEAIELIQDAKKLIHVRLNGLSIFPSYSTLKTLFQEKFPNITFYKFSTGDGELIMKKRNVPDWYLSFKLMDHF